MIVKVGFTANDSDPISVKVQKVQRFWFSHVVIRFDMPTGARRYFESIWKLDPATRKTGLRGPIPVENLEAWAAEDTKNKRLLWMPMDGGIKLTDDEANAMYQTLEENVAIIDYAPIQIWNNLWEQWLGFSMTTVRGTPKDWTCSETWARVIPARIAPYFGWPDKCADRITPKDVYEGMQRMIQIEGVRK